MSTVTDSTWRVGLPLLRLTLVLGMLAAAVASAVAAEPARLALEWKDNFLWIRGEHLPGPIRINYLEAYCRPGSTDRDWHETVIGHRAELVEADAERGLLRIQDTLRDGVVVRHTITASRDEVDFRLVAHNPTDKPSAAHWAQPCVRVDQFAGTGTQDAQALYPKYIRQSFIFLDGKPRRMPFEPWSTKARYTPGQVWVPRHVPPDDVNPRPVSKLVPSNGLIGTYSADEKQVVAVAWEPYQELFQGVGICIHSDFRIGGLEPGQTKHVRGKLYVVPADLDALVKRYERDFPEHVRQVEKD